MTNKNDMMAQRRKKQRFYALCGIITPMLFWFMVIVESLLRPGYSQFYNFVSDLGVGHLATLQNINFIIFGFLVICFALGLRNGLPVPLKRASKIGILFVIIFGFGVFLAGVFPENYLSEIPHNIVSATAFVAIIVAQLSIWHGLKNESDVIWGRYRTYSLISGLLSIIFVILLKFSMLYGIYPGLTQRAFLIISWIWIGISGIKIYSLTKKL